MLAVLRIKYSIAAQQVSSNWPEPLQARYNDHRLKHPLLCIFAVSQRHGRRPDVIINKNVRPVADATHQLPGWIRRHGAVGIRRSPGGPGSAVWRARRPGELADTLSGARASRLSLQWALSDGSLDISITCILLSYINYGFACKHIAPSFSQGPVELHNCRTQLTPAKPATSFQVQSGRGSASSLEQRVALLEAALADRESRDSSSQ